MAEEKDNCGARHAPSHQDHVTPSRSWRLIYSLTWEFAPISQCMLAGFPAFVGGFGTPAERKPHIDRAFHDHPPT
jgi:hypothetical protein